MFILLNNLQSFIQRIYPFTNLKYLKLIKTLNYSKGKYSKIWEYKLTISSNSPMQYFVVFRHKFCSFLYLTMEWCIRILR